MDEKTMSTREMLNMVISKLGLRDARNLPIQDIILWFGEAMRHIGGMTSKERVTKTVQIDNYIGSYPEDMQALVRIHGYPIFESKRTGFIIDLLEGEVTIEYDRWPLDPEGFPVFPNDASTADALLWYAAKFLSIQGFLPNLSPRYCEDQWQWYCGQARAEGYAPSMDQWERIINSHDRLVPLVNEYANGFANLHHRETLRRDPMNDFNQN